MVTDGDGVGERTPKGHEDRNTVEEHRSVNLGQRAPRAPRGGAEGGGGGG